MANPTYFCTKCSESVVGEGNQSFQCHVTAKGTIDTEQLCDMVAADLKCTAVIPKQVVGALSSRICENLAAGYRVTLEDFVRFELVGGGSVDYIDAPWDPERNKIIPSIVPYKDIAEAAANVVPSNELQPTAIQLLGVQDATTLEQDCYTKGNNLLIQGKYVKLDNTNAEEGVWIRLANGTEIKMTVTASTSATIDANCNLATLTPGEATLVIRGRDGKGRDYMLVEVTRPITIKAAA